MTVYAVTDTKNGEQGLRLLIFKLPNYFIAVDCYFVFWPSLFVVCRVTVLQRLQECKF